MNALRQLSPLTPRETAAGYFLSIARDAAALSEHGVFEALLPIRPFAMLLAARRADWSARSPERFADDADWLAATILVLQLAEVDIALDELQLLDTANQRLAELCGDLAIDFTPAQPRLVRAFAANGQAPLSGRTRLDLPAALANLSAIARSSTLSACCRAALPAPLAHVAGLA
ncbi:hypothetical protein [Crenobacter cavernae]|uniref:Uncharacterized protein n=1 Tax=Crenobacter cavernae TaxID=2290923 RepID=A0ABY0FEE6_9NEIS|nr:hypothetical protein [Crenobacter cavernae]RXZ43602.1 hypothetical protein EBB06_09570 [Crenobacter cavernae]